MENFMTNPNFASKMVNSGIFYVISWESDLQFECQSFSEDLPRGKATCRPHSKKGVCDGLCGECYDFGCPGTFLWGLEHSFFYPPNLGGKGGGIPPLVPSSTDFPPLISPPPCPQAIGRRDFWELDWFGRYFMRQLLSPPLCKDSNCKNQSESTKNPKIFPPPAGETIQSVFLAALRGLRQYPPSIGKAVAAFCSNLLAL